MHTWQYEGQDQQYNDDYPGYALFISNDNADRAGSLLFGKFLGKALQARGLQFTPHYTLPLMGHRRRQLLDADAGVYRYDQLVVLRYTRMPALLARSRLDRQPAGRTGIGDAGAPHAHQRGRRRRGRGILRGAGASENRAAGETAGQPAHRQSRPVAR